MNETDEDRLVKYLAKSMGIPLVEEGRLRELARDLNPELRERLVALLRTSATARSVSSASPSADPSSEAGSPLVVESFQRGGFSDPESSGRMIGGYKVLQQIGEGGCGTVYLAEQEVPVRRRVAIKVIKLGMDTKAVIARFEAERQALAMMDHPNIARIYEAGATERGRPYFVMEYVPGIPITNYCDQNRLNLRQRIELFIPVCQAIQHAHQKGIIHRDIKPSNILVTVQDGGIVAKVIDFGIAKATVGRLTDLTLFTAVEQFIGTPAYMSPEQADLTSLDIDTRSDVYSLGVLLYELLTDLTPFDSHLLLASGIDAVRKTIREVEPTRPSTRLSALAGDALVQVTISRGTEGPKLIGLIRGDLDWIVMKCLEKDRTRRYETVNGLAADLRRHLSNQVVVARPASLAYSLTKAYRRNKGLFAGVAAVGLALVLGIVFTTSYAYRASQAETSARKGQADAEALASFLTSVFVSPSPERDGREVKVVEILDKQEGNLLEKFSNQPERLAWFQNVLGDTYQKLGIDEKAIPLLEKAFHYYQLNPGTSTNELCVKSDLANAYESALTNSHKALVLREDVLKGYGTRYGFESKDAIFAKFSLANSYENVGRTNEAFELRKDVLKWMTNHLGYEHPDALRAMHNLANSYVDMGMTNEAFQLRKTVYELRMRILGTNAALTLTSLGNLACSYHDIGQENKARELFEQQVKLNREVWGPEHKETISSEFNLADACANFSETGDRAVELMQKVLGSYGRKYGPRHRDTLETLPLRTFLWDLSGGGIEVKTTEMEEDIGLEAFSIAVAIGFLDQSGDSIV